LVRCDVVIAGAGPAGAVAATILARAGLSVRLFDRARFPRPKLCGDTLNPGALRVLSRVIDIRTITGRALPLDGMTLTGPGVELRGTYGVGVVGHAITRRDLDALLLQAAIDAGAEFHDGATVLAALSTASGGVDGVAVRMGGGQPGEQRASMVLAADGRESRLARSLGLARHARRPRRWAIGGYFANARIDSRYGEMHVRRSHYVGVAPVPGGLANVCLVVVPPRGARWRDPATQLREVVRDDPRLAERFAHAELVDGPHVLGPMAVETTRAGVPGLLLAGDAAGFIDPVTGDGLRLALQGAELAAGVVLEAFSGRCAWGDAPVLLAARRRAAFARKWRFNRAIRTLLMRPAAVSGAAVAARVWPAAFRGVIRYAGDVA
jgi:flavin-dependent dehydrogenase